MIDGLRRAGLSLQALHRITKTLQSDFGDEWALASHRLTLSDGAGRSGPEVLWDYAEEHGDDEVLIALDSRQRVFTDVVRDELERIVYLDECAGQISPPDPREGPPRRPLPQLRSSDVRLDGHPGGSGHGPDRGRRTHQFGRPGLRAQYRGDRTRRPACSCHRRLTPPRSSSTEPWGDISSRSGRGQPRAGHRHARREPVRERGDDPDR